MLYGGSIIFWSEDFSKKSGSFIDKKARFLIKSLFSKVSKDGNNLNNDKKHSMKKTYFLMKGNHESLLNENR